VLQRRFTTGLYWLVHDHERDTHGDTAQVRWTQTFSELVEIHAENLLELLAPHVFDGGSAFFTEEQVGKLDGSAADCGIDFGEFVLVADIVQHAFTIPTRAYANVETFYTDIERAVVVKTRQLNGTIDRLLTTPDHPNHPFARRPDRVVPVRVEGANFPGIPFVYRHIREVVRREGYPLQPECTTPLVLSLNELEMLTALVGSGDSSASGITRG
jgi:hypothetical protein